MAPSDDALDDDDDDEDSSSDSSGNESALKKKAGAQANKKGKTKAVEKKKEKKHTRTVLKSKEKRRASSDDVLNDNNDDEASLCGDTTSSDESSVKKKTKKVEPRKKAAPKKNTKKGADVIEMGRRKVGPGRKKFAIAPNYSEDEDYLIAVAFVSVTVDPIRGVGQKSENFWSRVHEKFCMLQKSELGSDSYTRNKESIEQRWKKRISKSVQLWNKHYRQLKGTNKSG